MNNHWGDRSLQLPNTPHHAQPLKECSKCGSDAEPRSGIQLSPTRWVCGKCWMKKLSSK